MSDIKTTNKSFTHKEGVLDFLLENLEERIQEMGDKVMASKKLREIGEKDGLLQKIEEVLEHPLDSYSEVSNRISDQLKNLIVLKISAELSDFSDSISHLWIMKNTGDDLHFIISLNESSFEKRDQIREVAVAYQMKAISDRHRVVFQFIDSSHESDLFQGALKRLDEQVPEQS